MEALLTTSCLLLMKWRNLLSQPFYLYPDSLLHLPPRTNKSGVSWEFVSSRIKKLIVPFVIWTTILMILLRRFPPTLQELLTVYYYIPLIIQYYLLSPILVPLARNHWKLLLVVSAVIQLGLGFLRLPALLGLDWPGVDLIIRLTPIWFFPEGSSIFRLVWLPVCMFKSSANGSTGRGGVYCSPHSSHLGSPYLNMSIWSVYWIATGSFRFMPEL